MSTGTFTLLAFQVEVVESLGGVEQDDTGLEGAMDNEDEDDDEEDRQSEHSAPPHPPMEVAAVAAAAGESDMDLDLLAESESDSESDTHSNHGDNQSIQRSAVTAATAGSDAGME